MRLCSSRSSWTIRSREFGVEGAERLVHQKAERPAHDGAAERHALAVAAGKARDRFVEQMIDAQQLCHLLDALADLALGSALGEQRKPMFLRTFMCG